MFMGDRRKWKGDTVKRKSTSRPHSSEKKE